MKSQSTIRYVDCTSLPELARPLSDYLFLNARIAAVWQWKDVPWWYNERASLSVFAGAVWNSGGIAFEEFTSTKSAFKAKRRSTYAGRTDLFIQVRGKRFVIEAKNIFLSSSSKTAVARINGKLAEAINDVRKAPLYGGQRLAIVFVAPRFLLSQRHDLQGAIQKWIKEIQTVRYTAAAWVFPEYRKSKAVWSKTRLFPGVAIFIKRGK